MARFDYYQGARGRGYLLDCQSEFLEELGSRVVIPLMPASGLPIASRLNPVFEIEGEKHVMSTHLIFAIPFERLGKRKGSLIEEHYAIMVAFDMLISGY